MQENGGNRLVPGLDYMVDALKLPHQALKVSGKSLQMCVAWRCPDETQHIFCWPILAVCGQLLVSNVPVVDRRNLNLVFGPKGETLNKLFLFRPVKCIVEPSWMLVLVWSPFELLHCALITIVFAQYCTYVTHFSSPATIGLRNGSLSFRLARASQMEIRSIVFFGVNWCSTKTSSFFLNSTLS
ncbi:hypothetical protein TNCV_2252191 [Trichonephila clavipes]|nr:hypothetical protein TNCV_2252191 [Trichonephila clavipes]